MEKRPDSELPDMCDVQQRAAAATWGVRHSEELLTRVRNLLARSKLLEAQSRQLLESSHQKLQRDN